MSETRREDDVLVVRSGRVLTLSEWHSVRVGRYRRKLYLWVDGMVNYAVLQPSEGISDFENIIYFGERVPSSIGHRRSFLARVTAATVVNNNTQDQRRTRIEHI